MSEFKKGDKVTLKKSSRYFYQCLKTELEGVKQLNGIITHDNNLSKLGYKYRVTWSDNFSNLYRDIDIELVKPDKPKIDFLSIFTKEQKEALTNFINEQIETKLKKYE
jgi:hypothetical protein